MTYRMYIGLTHMDENHDFVNLYNATSKNETGNDHLNESIFPNNENFCKYYTPDELIKTIGLENKQLSMFSHDLRDQDSDLFLCVCVCVCVCGCGCACGRACVRECECIVVQMY